MAKVLLFTPRKKITLFDWGKLQNFDLTLPLIPNQEQKHIQSVQHFELTFALEEDTHRIIVVHTYWKNNLHLLI